MTLTVYDLLNTFICILVLTYFSIVFQYSNKVILLLGLHLLLVLFIPIVIPYSYMPDQFRYADTAQSLRNTFSTSEKSTVYFASAIFAVMPIFIDSVRSIAFINFLVYLGLLNFVLLNLKNENLIKIFFVFYLCYPSLILYSSFGVRDILILLFMFLSSYFLWIKPHLRNACSFIILLFLVKPQNAIILILAYMFSYILKFSGKVRLYFLSSFIAIVSLLLYKFQERLMFLRTAMFSENSQLPVEFMPSFHFYDSLNFMLQPTVFTAKNVFQYLQSLENILVIMLILGFIYLRKINGLFMRYIYTEVMLLIACIIYSYIVVNYGTLVRYKFPFIVCYMAINLLLLEKYSESKRLDKNRIKPAN